MLNPTTANWPRQVFDFVIFLLAIFVNVVINHIFYYVVLTHITLAVPSHHLRSVTELILALGSFLIPIIKFLLTWSIQAAARPSADRNCIAGHPNNSMQSNLLHSAKPYSNWQLQVNICYITHLLYKTVFLQFFFPTLESCIGNSISSLIFKCRDQLVEEPLSSSQRQLTRSHYLELCLLVSIAEMLFSYRNRGNFVLRIGTVTGTIRGKNEIHPLKTGRLLSGANPFLELRIANICGV